MAFRRQEDETARKIGHWHQRKRRGPRRIGEGKNAVFEGRGLCFPSAIRPPSIREVGRQCYICPSALKFPPFMETKTLRRGPATGGRRNDDCLRHHTISGQRRRVSAPAIGPISERRHETQIMLATMGPSGDGWGSGLPAPLYAKPKIVHQPKIRSPACIGVEKPTPAS